MTLELRDIIVIGLAAAGAIGVFFSAWAWRRRRPRAKIRDILAGTTGGKVKIAGVIANQTALLMAPLSGRPCVYFQVEVLDFKFNEQVWGQGGGVGIEFTVSDESAKVQVVASTQCPVETADDIIHYDDEDQSFIDFLAEAGVLDPEFSRNHDLVVRERVLVVGDEVIVSGAVTTGATSTVLNANAVRMIGREPQFFDTKHATTAENRPREGAGPFAAR